VADTVRVWRDLGVQIDGPLEVGFVADVYGTVSGLPSIGLDEDNGQIVKDYLDNAMVPEDTYRTILPSALDEQCDDIFYLPHADPTWADHGQLKPFVEGGGFLWSACHAVSVLESIDDPADGDEESDLNFLTTGRLALFRDDPDHPDHEDGTPPYTYDRTLSSAPVMQFLGAIDDATTNGSEQIFLPAAGSEWRDSAQIAIWDPDHENLASEGAGMTTSRRVRRRCSPSGVALACRPTGWWSTRRDTGTGAAMTPPTSQPNASP
jgi:hypothetical protein